MTGPDDYLRPRMEAAGIEFLPSVRPLAVPDVHGLELVHAGSAVLVVHRAEHYLLSAAHVVEACPDRAYYLGTQTTWMAIDGHWTVNAIAVGSRESDTIDVAFKRVDSGFAHSLDGCAFVQPSRQALDEDINFAPPYRSKYLTIGYPTNAFEYRRHRRTTATGTIGVAATIASPDAHVRERLNPNLNIVLDYEWDAVIGERGPQRSPKLDGISGGAILRVPGLESRDETSAPMLVGLTIEERRERRLLVGTRLGVFFKFIDGDAQHRHGPEQPG